MRLTTKIKLTPNCAIFSRNYPYHLDNAAKRGKELTTFRSQVSWSSTQTAIDRHGPRKIYFASVGAKELITYEAILKQVKLNPKWDDPETQQLLSYCLPTTSHENLWEDNEGRTAAATLYVISECQKLASPFPITDLKKLSDNKPIDENFGYSYAIVYEKEINQKVNTETYLPEEVTDAANYYEGATRRISINTYERDPEARKACIAHYGTTCSICKFNFANKYGQVGEGFIHVHHLKPLAQVGEQYQVDPIRDLRPVCPNCHAIIHKRTPPYSIEEVKALLQEASRRNDNN